MWLSCTTGPEFGQTGSLIGQDYAFALCGVHSGARVFYKRLRLEALAALSTDGLPAASVSSAFLLVLLLLPTFHIRTAAYSHAVLPSSGTESQTRSRGGATQATAVVRVADRFRALAKVTPK